MRHRSDRLRHAEAVLLARQQTIPREPSVPGANSIFQDLLNEVEETAKYLRVVTGQSTQSADLIWSAMLLARLQLTLAQLQLMLGVGSSDIQDVVAEHLLALTIGQPDKRSEVYEHVAKLLELAKYENLEASSNISNLDADEHLPSDQLVEFQDITDKIEVTVHLQSALSILQNARVVFPQFFTEGDPATKTISFGGRDGKRSGAVPATPRGLRILECILSQLVKEEHANQGT